MEKRATLGEESTLLHVLSGDRNHLRSMIAKSNNFDSFLSFLGNDCQLLLDETVIPETTYSGYYPKLFFTETPSEGALSYALWIIARNFYLSDKADLSAWINDSLTFSYEEISKITYIKKEKKFDFVVREGAAMIAGFLPDKTIKYEGEIS